MMLRDLNGSLSDMDIKILIALNKAYPVPDDPAYLPIYVGSYGRSLLDESNSGALDPSAPRDAADTLSSDAAAQKDVPVQPCAFDCTGDNISEKNPSYCELTALYWAWKNLDADYIGLVHYRRYFRGSSWCPELYCRILSSAELERHLSNVDLILPKKRKYRIETIDSHFRHTHEPEALDLTREIISERCPDYLRAFDDALDRTKAHMFNMMIAKKDIVDAYCSWLFDILGELEKRLDITGYSDFEARVFGRIGEMLLDVWVIHNGIPYREVPFVFVEETNWPRKIKGFLMAKYFDRKYTGST